MEAGNRINGATHRSASLQDSSHQLVKHLLDLGQLQLEKCELNESERTFVESYELSRHLDDPELMSRALARLLQLAGENLDEEKIEKWNVELDRLLSTYPAEEIHPDAWYGKGTVADYREDYRQAQHYYHRSLRALKARLSEGPNDPEVLQRIARVYTVLVSVFIQKGHLKRADWFCDRLTDAFEARELKSVNGMIYFNKAVIADVRKDYATALKWYRKADAAFLAEHNWYFHLYVLRSYGRLARLERNFDQAYWYLNLVENACRGDEFGYFKKVIASEKQALEDDSVDLVIDSERGVVKTRESDEIAFGKQYVLLEILKALSKAHDSKMSSSSEGSGLSKAALIKRVWKESYRPEAHDNKLYYNINRLRRLIEPDCKHPKYLLNWKEGYRLAPGLRVHLDEPAKGYGAGREFLQEGE